jgi:hypothetical protein
MFPAENLCFEHGAPRRKLDQQVKNDKKRLFLLCMRKLFNSSDALHHSEDFQAAFR